MKRASFGREDEWGDDGSVGVMHKVYCLKRHQLTPRDHGWNEADADNAGSARERWMGCEYHCVYECGWLSVDQYRPASSEER